MKKGFQLNCRTFLFFVISLMGLRLPCPASFVDLEKEMSHESVLELKRIEIPEYPSAFNASIIRWNGALLMSFRFIPNPKTSFTSYLGVVWLDEQLRPVGQAQLLQTREEGDSVPSRAEDGRLVIVDGRLYLVYSDNRETKISKGGFRVYVAELQVENDIVRMGEPECLSKYEGESRAIREKNWVPFDYQGRLLLAYSLTSHRIFYPLLSKSEECLPVASTQGAINWKWGVLRGGTPAVLVDDEYFAIFHSSIDMPSVHSQGNTVSHYFMGAYTFAKDPPFAITRCSVQPIIGKGFYSGTIYKPYWKPVKAIFPCGLLVEEQQIWVTYGRDDHEIWVVKLDKEKLFQSLVEVQNAE